jgi:serine protease inhibitor
MRIGSAGMTSRLSQLLICISTIAVAIVVLVFMRQDILLADHASKLTPPKHLRAYLDTFSSTLNNVSSLTSTAFDNFLTASSNSMNTITDPVFTNVTALPEASVLNSFANKFFVHHTPDSLFSPVSILYAISYLQLGTNFISQSKAPEILDMESLSQYFAHFSMATNADARMVQLLCVNQEYPIQTDFQTNYGHFLPILTGNFSNKPSMNENIRRQFMPATQNDVNPIAKGIRPDTTAILYDTFYFRAIWADPFLETQTKYIDFMPSNKKKRNIRALHRVFRRLSYYENELFQMVEIPFDPNRYVFGILLPKTNAAKPLNIKYDVDFQVLQDVHIPQLQGTSNVLITVPKLRQRQWLRLSSSVKKLSPVYRNLFEKGIPHIAQQSERLNEVIHEVPLTIWEAGANIAENTATQSATNDVSHSHGVLEDTVANVHVVADHQFVYYVRDRLTNVLLLVGDFDA